MSQTNTIKEIVVANFAGGLNTRDSSSEVAENEFVDSMNVSIDERGVAHKRLGYQQRYASALGSGVASNTFWWATRGALITQIGTGTHMNNGTSFKTWTTSARIGMAEFNGNLFMNHPVDGMFYYDGSTVTAVGTAPKGDALASWQNKLWINDVVNPARVWFSAAGDGTSWIGTAFNTIREKDTKKVTCLTGASGIDISGRPGLLALKEDSCYRIYDSATGAYSTIDASIGTASNIGAVSIYGRVYVASPRGIFWTDGTNPMVEASGKIDNFFTGSRINTARADLCTAGRYQDKLWFSYPRVSATANGIAFEHRPGIGTGQGWVVPHSCAASAYAQTTDGTELVIADPVVAGRVHNFNVTGSDNGTAISSFLQTRWIEPNYGNLVRIRRIRFVGNGILSATLLQDYESGISQAPLAVNISSSGFKYDESWKYDEGVPYGPGAFQNYQDFYSVGVQRAFALYLSETSTISGQGRSIIGSSANEIGAWELSHVNAMTINLGTH